MSDAVLQQMVNALELAERTIREMDARRCKNCARWKPATIWEYGAGDIEGGRCQSGKFVEDSYRERDVVVYPYMEGAGSDWWTGPEFGCVHWSERDGTADQV